MTMGYPLNPTVTLDFSGERCARSVQGLSSMTRGQLEAFLQETALASASVILVRPRRPKPEKIRRDRRRHQWR
jgi:hypothetical protein